MSHALRREPRWSRWLRWLRGPGTSKPRPRWALALPTALFLGITAFVAVDIAADVADGVGLVHLTVEAGALVLCLAGVAANGVELARESERAHALQRDLECTRTDLARSLEEAVALRRGLSSTLERQFQKWALTPAEREVALLILKGLSYKEIAQVRSSSERTIRHQAISIFHKAELSGRAEMAAFFLEDLLLPRVAPPAPPPAACVEAARGLTLAPPSSGAS